jgi:hypothetical protein
MKIQDSFCNLNNSLLQQALSATSRHSDSPRYTLRMTDTIKHTVYSQVEITTSAGSGCLWYALGKHRAW